VNKGGKDRSSYASADTPHRKQSSLDPFATFHRNTLHTYQLLARTWGSARSLLLSEHCSNMALTYYYQLLVATILDLGLAQAGEVARGGLGLATAVALQIPALQEWQAAHLASP